MNIFGHVKKAEMSWFLLPSLSLFFAASARVRKDFHRGGAIWESAGKKGTFFYLPELIFIDFFFKKSPARRPGK